MLRNRLVSPAATFGLLALSAMPALANHIDQASVTVNSGCNTYTISVSGGALDHPSASVHYSITVSGSGSPTTITGSIAVTPDPYKNFSATFTGSFGAALPSGASLSGSATLFTDGGATLWNTVSLGCGFTSACPVPPPP